MLSRQFTKFVKSVLLLHHQHKSEYLNNLNLSCPAVDGGNSNIFM